MAWLCLMRHRGHPAGDGRKDRASTCPQVNVWLRECPEG
jgi:hypothetical protein